MSKKRCDAIERLKSLTAEQIADIVLVIETSETQMNLGI